ncbi:ribonuclease H1 domain-containing protein [Microaceticoccus formicicus]|uniref:ribonuclease H1 domain-containing protein n=1 Tax=Microaceticoccus formicicus TaxID=3118105 RepID=UPI003CD03732|nr:ribonuclease H family protein [Peptoniphilaceae bacterium AMB_02]
MKTSKKYYAVKVGKTPGIYETWEECQKQVKGFSGAVFKSFKLKRDAENYILEDAQQNNPFNITDSTKNGGELAEEIIMRLKEDEMVAYVDGSFNSKKRIFGYGVVIFTSSGKSEYSGSSTCEDCVDFRNVAGEVYGAVYAMKRAVHHKIQKLYLHYDYTGIKHWAKGEWKRNNLLTKKYHDYYNSIVDKLEVQFIKVEAHTGDTFNEEADRLAKEACGNS